MNNYEELPFIICYNRFLTSGPHLHYNQSHNAGRMEIKNPLSCQLSYSRLFHELAITAARRLFAVVVGTLVILVVGV